MTFRIAKLHDYPQFASICGEWDNRAWPRNPEIEEFFEDHYQAAANSDGTAIPQVWVALNDKNIPIGMMSIIADDHPDYMHLSPWLASAFVMPEYRGQGIFQALQKHVLEFARNELDTPCLYVYSHIDFSKTGWRAIEQIIDPFAPDKQVTLFEYKF